MKRAAFVAAALAAFEWPTCHALPGGELVEPEFATRSLDALAEIELRLPPGRYRVQPQPPIRYQRPEPFEIEVPEVGFALHTVHLVRRP